MANIQLLINSIKLLSMPYEEQRNYLPGFVGDGLIQDDVLTDFDIAFSIVPILMEKKELSYEAVKQILKCNNLISLNLTRPDLPPDAFKDHPDWGRVRELGRELLLELNAG